MICLDMQVQLKSHERSGRESLRLLNSNNTLCTKFSKTVWFRCIRLKIRKKFNLYDIPLNHEKKEKNCPSEHNQTPQFRHAGNIKGRKQKTSAIDAQVYVLSWHTLPNSVNRPKAEHLFATFEKDYSKFFSPFLPWKISDEEDTAG